MKEFSTGFQRMGGMVTCCGCIVVGFVVLFCSGVIALAIIGSAEHSPPIEPPAEIQIEQQ